MIKRIVLLVDFTGVSQLALEHTTIIARQSICQVILLHIAAEGKQQEEKEIKSKVRDFALPMEKEGVSYLVQVNFGQFFEVIKSSIENLNADLLIIGTHGIKGIKQNFLSSNILKLLSNINIPALVIQGHSMNPQEGYSNILIPLLHPAHLIEKKDSLLKFAKLFKSNLQFLGFYNKENEITLSTNELSDWFNNEEISSSVEMEETSVYTSSFSKSIIQYADIEDTDVFVLMIHDKTGCVNFDLMDKENILLNRLGKPVLCL
jgi:nucleotide-binding universal stress UspA family protein